MSVGVTYSERESGQHHGRKLDTACRAARPDCAVPVAIANEPDRLIEGIVRVATGT